MPLVTAPDGQQYNLGYRRRQHDPRSDRYNWANYVRPAAVDLTQPRVFWGQKPDPRLPILDQKQMGSCSSFGAPDSATESERMQGQPAVELMHDYAYWKARVKEGTFPEDAGSDPLDILGFCQDGMPPQSAQAGGYVDNPSLSFAQYDGQATLKYVQSYHAIYPGDSPNMETLVWQALDAGYPVCMATLWTNAMFSPSRGLIPSGQTPAMAEGGHCIRCYGIVPNYYLCDNQWGTSWSADAAASGFPGMRPGGFAMPWAYGRKNSLIDFMAVVVGVSSPAPGPGPNPPPPSTGPTQADVDASFASIQQQLIGLERSDAANRRFYAYALQVEQIQQQAVDGLWSGQPSHALAPRVEEAGR